jgi:hypothetical protein
MAAARRTVRLARVLWDRLGAPGGVEPPTNGLGNRCSIHLSYGALLFINNLQIVA